MSFENLPPNFDISQDGTHSVFNLSIVKSTKDDRSYKLIRLPNQLEALLIHDPETDKAGASLDVAIGSYSNPEHLQGLAHYLEHLLFMGTEKYPGENEYSEYLTQHNGSHNAFTTDESTCYYFEANHEYLDETLDRFAQFFICPLFKPDANDRELKAVDSEFKTGLQNNFSRLYQLLQTHCNPLHPKHKFTIGNLESLKEIPKQKGLNVHEEVRKFYDQHYSANIMKLAILGKDSLEQMTKWVVEKFSAVKNKGVSSIKHTELPYRKSELCKQIAFKPIQEGHNIYMIIPLPDINPYYKSKPGNYISHCVGHEGVGSIFSLLKNKGWIVSLYAGPYEEDSTHRSFSIYIVLTDEGLKNYEEVVEIVFQYIVMLRRTGPQEWIFREMQSISDIYFRFKEKINATYDTLLVAYYMKEEYPRELILSAPYLYYEYDPKAISECLKNMTIENTLIVMNSQNLSGFDRKEKWYGTEYKYQEISEKLIKALENPNIHPELKLPAPNKFIPTNFNMNKLENLTKSATRPDLIKDASISRVWYKKDDKWWVPKAEIVVAFKSPLLYILPSNIVKTKLYIDLFHQAIAEEVYDASAACLYFYFYASGSTIQLSISGYNDKCSNLLSVIINKMKNLVIESNQFTYIKEKAKMDYKNILLTLPTSQSGRYLNGILSEKSWRPEDCLKVLEDISEQDIRDFYPELLKNLHIESYFLGNLEKQEVLDMVTKIEDTFSPKELIKMQLIGYRSIHLPEGKKYVFQHLLEDKDEPNSAVLYYIQIGDVMDLEKRCKLRLVNQIVKEYVFNELRTKEQLGYIVSNYLSFRSGEMGLNFAINSEKDTVYLENRIEAFISVGQKLIEEMTDEDYKKQQKSLIDSLLEKNKNLNGEAWNHLSYINSGYYDFDRITKDVEEIKKISKPELLEFYKTWFVPSSPSIKKLSVHSRSHKCISKPIDGESENDYKLAKDNIIIEDIVDFKSKMYLGPTAFPVVDLKTYYKE